jgi:microcystin-dependent protein
MSLVINYQLESITALSGVLSLGANTGGLVLPTGGTSSRPAGVQGMLRYNSDGGGAVEIYNGAAWTSFNAGVVGPISSTNRSIPVWSGTGGNTLTNSPVLLDTIGNISLVNSISGTSVNFNTGTFTTATTQLQVIANADSTGSQLNAIVFTRNGTTVGHIDTNGTGMVIGAGTGGSAGFLNLVGGFGTGGVTIATDGKVLVGGATYDGTSSLNVAGTATFQTQVNAPTLGTTDNSTKVATTAFVQSVLGLAVPAGAITAYAGASAPNGWLLAYGQNVSRTTYANLYNAISTTYGTGDGATTFTLPDLRGRTAFGVDNMGGSSPTGRITTATVNNPFALNGSGGAQTQTMSISQMPSHTHGVNDPAHSHSFTAGETVGAQGGQAAGENGEVTINTGFNTNGAYTNISIQAQGGGQPITTLPPVILLNYIIKY